METCCKIEERRIFGKLCNQGFCSIENNCIIVYYFRKLEKVEFFYNLSDLQIERTVFNQTILTDPKNHVQITINMIVNLQSTEASIDDSDKFFDFEASGYKVYSEPRCSSEGKMSSFTPSGALRFFDE